MSKDTQTTKEENGAPKGRVFRGVVASNKMQNAATVLVTRYVKHPKYQKFIKRSKKIMAHDADNSAEVGDKVEIQEVAPISKRKRFVILKK